MVSQTCGLNAVTRAAPCHDRGALGNTALEYLVPTYDLAAVVVEKLLDSLGDVCLKFGLILQALLADTFLACGALFPEGFGALVAADVDIFRGE